MSGKKENTQPRLSCPKRQTFFSTARPKWSQCISLLFNQYGGHYPTARQKRQNAPHFNKHSFHNIFLLKNKMGDIVRPWIGTDKTCDTFHKSLSVQHWTPNKFVILVVIISIGSLYKTYCMKHIVWCHIDVIQYPWSFFREAKKLLNAGSAYIVLIHYIVWT